MTLVLLTGAAVGMAVEAFGTDGISRGLPIALLLYTQTHTHSQQ